MSIKMVLSVRRYVGRLYATSGIAYDELRECLAPESRKYQLQQNPEMGTLEMNFKLKELVKSGYLNDARKMFDSLSQRDEITWTTMISGYVNASDYSEGLTLFSKMWVEPNLHMDPFVLSLAFKACGLNANVRCGESLHGYSVKTGFLNSVFVGSALLDMYTKSNKISEGCRVFHEMPLKNVVSWTAIMTGLVRASYNKEALMYFVGMRRDCVEYDSYTFAIALKACADTFALNNGREIHAQTMKRGYDVISFVANSLSTMYNKCGKLEYGLCLFEKMVIRDVVSWTTMITSYVQMGHEERAIQAFLHMRESDVSPNEYTFAAIIAACANVVRIDWGEQMHGHVFCAGFVNSPSVENSLITMYSKSGRLDAASMVFHGMAQRDIVSWSTIISGFANGGCGDTAFEYLSSMRKDGQKPTEFALSSVLSVCGTMAILEQGKQIHAHVLVIGLDHTAMLQSALINMYSKCGSIGEAARIFGVAVNNDIVSWTTMINGYAEHGYSKEAIDLFEKFSKVGMKPDPVTFIGVLSACSHAGLVELGFHYFSLMSNNYGLLPSKEHYGCMIDLLCRAGRLIDAERMIRSMPSKQDDVVWSTLLRACRVHGDAECGRRAAEEILKLDPNCAGTHITLANIYSAKGWWREAAAIRKLMRSKGVIKEPGWSWIKLRDYVSAFVAGDRLHPECEDIYSMLYLISYGAEIMSHEDEIND